jgi:isoquinoline 1-oxidoreductase beta subunit
MLKLNVNGKMQQVDVEADMPLLWVPILYQENNIKDGRIVESNFHNFRLPQINEMPKVEAVLVPTGGFWGGHGEAAILALAPAVCNAIFAATGQRIGSLPLKNHDLRMA